MRTYKRLSALLCAAVLLAGCCGLAVFADETADVSEAVTEPTVITCTEVPLYSDIDDRYIGSGYVVDSVTYVPLLTFTEYVIGESCQVEWDQETRTAVISAEGLTIEFAMDRAYMVANDRYIYLEDGAYNINGTIVVPIREVARIFSLSPQWDDGAWAIRIDTQDAEILAPGAEFYDAGDLYWLSRVIFSEAGNQPLEGMIGVGNVVLNRLNDESGAFGRTLYAVIFAENQFNVVQLGTIYCTPSAAAEAAAKLCLEGYNTVGDSLWFLNPVTGNPRWFNAYKTYNLTIGDHAFYT